MNAITETNLAIQGAFATISAPDAVNLMLTNKGGVGKTTSMVLLAEYMLAHGVTPICWDADSATNTLSQYTGLAARIVKPFDGQGFHPEVMEDWLNVVAKEVSPQIIDTGTSMFTTILDFLFVQEHLHTLIDAGKSPIMHFVVSADADTIEGLDKLLNASAAMNMPVPAVVWVNPNMGPVSQALEIVLMAHADRILARVNLPLLAAMDSTGRIKEHFTVIRRLFSEVIAEGTGNLVNDSRFFRVWGQISAALDEAFGVITVSAGRKASLSKNAF